MKASEKETIFKLKAENSSGLQELYLDNFEDEFAFTLVGTFNDEKIQIDFDSFTFKDFDIFVKMVNKKHRQLKRRTNLLN